MDNCEESGTAFFEPGAEFPCLVEYWQHFRLGIVIVERDIQRKEIVHDLFYSV